MVDPEQGAAGPILTLTQACLAAAQHRELSVVQPALCCWLQLGVAAVPRGVSQAVLQGIWAVCMRCAPTDQNRIELQELDVYRREVRDTIRQLQKAGYPVELLMAPIKASIELPQV